MSDLQGHRETDGELFVLIGSEVIKAKFERVPIAKIRRETRRETSLANVAGARK